MSDLGIVTILGARIGKVALNTLANQLVVNAFKKVVKERELQTFFGNLYTREKPFLPKLKDVRLGMGTLRNPIKAFKQSATTGAGSILFLVSAGVSAGLLAAGIFTENILWSRQEPSCSRSH